MIVCINILPNHPSGNVQHRLSLLFYPTIHRVVLSSLLQTCHNALAG